MAGQKEEYGCLKGGPGWVGAGRVWIEDEDEDGGWKRKIVEDVEEYVQYMEEKECTVQEG